ncbi:thioredoxin [Flexibacterium corallicola]|uniref:thioredoxin n=1 Tax=Flexibacterium corallicola TaxID=3037259 RepID=UPI00286F62DD|nr:thioredoxin [Pseudovibrio sp. M1P-2-3]
MSGSGFSVGGSLGGTMSGGFGGSYQTTVSASEGKGAFIKETSTQSFMKDVIEASSQQPVLVDFWAPWCEPCKQLTPIIEKVVTEANGAVTLVKMNIEDHPEVAGQMGVQSIPAVVAFVNGQPVDGFMGAQQEGQIKKFIEKLGVRIGPSDVDVLLDKANAAREAQDFAGASQAYGAVLSLEEQNTAALSGLVHCCVAGNDLAQAKQILEMVPESGQSSQDYIAAKAALDLAEQAENLDDLAGLRLRVEQSENDLDARFEYAVALNAKALKTEAVDQLIEIIKSDREWNEDSARKQLLQFFEAWGFKDPASVYGRRKLSSVLFS